MSRDPVSCRLRTAITVTRATGPIMETDIFVEPQYIGAITERAVISDTRDNMRLTTDYTATGRQRGAIPAHFITITTCTDPHAIAKGLAVASPLTTL